MTEKEKNIILWLLAEAEYLLQVLPAKRMKLIGILEWEQGKELQEMQNALTKPEEYDS